MTTLEARYRRLLRWYPRAWRASHGVVLIGTLMDAADAEGRSRPTSGEARSLMMHGLGERFTLRTALFSAFGALLSSFAGILTMFIGVDTAAQFDGGWVPLGLSLLAASTAGTVSVLALMHHVNLLRPDRVVPVLILAALAWTCAFLTAWAWSIGFDVADAGLVRTPFSLAFSPLFGVGWLLGGLSIALVVLELSRSLPRGIRWAVAATGAVICPPLIGLPAYSPFIGVMTALVLTVISAILVARQDPTRIRTTTSHPARALTAKTRRRVGIVALLCAFAGAACAVYAVLGSALVPAVGSTRVMQLGLSAGGLVILPLLLAVAWLMTGDRSQRALLRGGMLLVSVAIAGHAISTIGGAGASGDVPWLAVITLATGVGLVTFAFVKAVPFLRTLIAFAVVVATLFPLWGLLVTAGFIAPIAATGLAIWGLRTRREPQPNPAQLA